VGRRKWVLKDFKELRVWKKAHEVTLELYRLTRQFPREELYGLTSQIRRAAIFDGGEHSRRLRPKVGR
jgi:23S rRNA-intervening sequence protein